MSEDRHPNGRLDSWKEIAAYLNRDVRTVIRWERKGLPVHRVPGGKRQAVFAYPAEIDAWLSGQNPNDNPSALPNQHQAGDSSDSTAGLPLLAEVDPATTANDLPKPTRIQAFVRNPWRLGIATVCVLVLAWITGAMVLPSRTSARVHPLSLQQLTNTGRAKASLRTDGKTLYFTQTEGARTVLASVPVSGGPVRVIDTPFSNVVLHDLSRDGRYLLVSSYEGVLLEGPLWIVPAQGGAPHRVGDAVCRFARWSPDNREIACANGTAISLLSADGSNARVLESSSSPAGPVIWSPDGRRLRYVLEDTVAHTFSQWEIEIGPDGNSGPAHRLDFGPNCCNDWTWTADHREFAYADYLTDGKARLMMQAGGVGSSTELPVNIGALFGVAAGGASSALYLNIADAFRGEFLKFNPRQKTLQTFLPGVSAAFVAFSPDGKWITYSDTQDFSLWRSLADGSDAIQLIKPPVVVQVSSWSPDGREIAFMAQKPGKPWRIYLTGRDGGPAREVSNGADNQGGPSFSPDGRALVYGNVFCEETQDCWIHRVDLRTRRSEILPGSHGLRTARWSPNGKYIAALRFRARELVLFDIAKRRWRVLAESVAGDNVNWSSDSRYIYVDSPRDEKPIIEKIRVADGQRSTVVSLASFEKVPGAINTWFGLTPDDSPLLCHTLNTSEIYALNWTDR